MLKNTHVVVRNKESTPSSENCTKSVMAAILSTWSFFPVWNDGY